MKKIKIAQVMKSEKLLNSIYAIFITITLFNLLTNIKTYRNSKISNSQFKYSENWKINKNGIIERTSFQGSKLLEFNKNELSKSKSYLNTNLLSSVNNFIKKDNIFPKNVEIIIDIRKRILSICEFNENLIFPIKNILKSTIENSVNFTDILNKISLSKKPESIEFAKKFIADQIFKSNSINFYCNTKYVFFQSIDNCKIYSWDLINLLGCKNIIISQNKIILHGSINNCILNAYLEKIPLFKIYLSKGGQRYDKNFKNITSIESFLFKFFEKYFKSDHFLDIKKILLEYLSKNNFYLKPYKFNYYSIEK